MRSGRGERTCRVVFSGCAAVHFVCFAPLYQRLRTDPRFEVRLSGGLKTKTVAGVSYDVRALHDALDVVDEHVLPVDTMRQQSFDIAICAHTSGLYPARQGALVQLFHGCSFRNVYARGKPGEDPLQKYDHLFVLGPYMERLLRDRGLVRDGDRRIHRIGFPKLDRLCDGSLDRRQVSRRLKFPEDRPTLLCAPTGAPHNSLETMGAAVIRQLAQAGAYNVLIKLHDHPKRPTSWRERLQPLLSPHVRLVQDHDIVPYLVAADLLLTDASSVAYEYAVLDRQIVYLDVPKLLAREKRKGRPVDLRTHGRKGGLLVRSPDQVISAVERSLRHPTARSALRRACAHDLFFNLGTATKAAMDWFEEQLEQRRLARGRKACRV